VTAALADLIVREKVGRGAHIELSVRANQVTASASGRRGCEPSLAAAAQCRPAPPRRRMAPIW
jgi:hypothetical protein